jgi:ribose 5-phosphate isomerase B
MNTREKDGVIAVASDHAGYLLKSILCEDLKTLGYQVLDLGTDSLDSVDYPLFAHDVAATVASGRVGCGVVLCGTGIGVSIAANRHPGVRAALCHNAETARLSRKHNDANVLALGARIIDEKTAKSCLRAFLDTEFEGGGRHERRVAMINTMVSVGNNTTC